MTIPYNNLLMAIWAERRYQDEKWGPLEKQNSRNPELWVNTLKEEVEEVSEAWWDDREDDFFLELVQVAAVALAALEQLAPDDLCERVKKHRST